MLCQSQNLKLKNIFATSYNYLTTLLIRQESLAM